jgi:PQQ-dependent dehydrogenase (methanol/ethanol family)
VGAVVGGNWGNQRYSTLARINTSNVTELKGAWMARLGSGIGSKYSQQATPVVKDGVMYITTGQQDVFALSARSGEMLWSYEADINPDAERWRNRGVALGDNKVFAVQTDGRVIALDEKSGKRVWETRLGEDLDPGVLRYLAAAPLYHDGIIYTGLSGSDGGLRGRLTALEAKTGKELWRWYTIPSPGEFGSDTWEGDSWRFGGGGIWMTPSIDPDLGLIYLPVGNAWPDYDGGGRGGDNLFTASLVALDYKTGQYRWHFQAVHHEIWDYDAGNTPVLFDTVVNGQPRKGIAQTAKTGWAGMSFSPQTGYIYVTAALQNTAYSVRHEGFDASGKRVTTGGGGPFTPLGSRARGTLTAMDPATNRIVWQKDMPYPIGGASGAMTTAGGIVSMVNRMGTSRRTMRAPVTCSGSSRPASAPTVRR